MNFLQLATVFKSFFKKNILFILTVMTKILDVTFTYCENATSNAESNRFSICVYKLDMHIIHCTYAQCVANICCSSSVQKRVKIEHSI